MRRCVEGRKGDKPEGPKEGACEEPGRLADWENEWACSTAGTTRLLIGVGDSEYVRLIMGFLGQWSVLSQSLQGGRTGSHAKRRTLLFQTETKQ